LQEAESLYRRALSIDEDSFGQDHPRVATHLSNLATLLKDTDRLAEAEKLYRRALAIDELSFGWDHPNVAIDLNNLAAVLEAAHRLEEAEELMQQMLSIFLRFSASSGRRHPFLQTATRNYVALLAEMGRDPTQIYARLNNLTRRFGINADALSEIVLQSEDLRLVQSTASIIRYRAAFTSLLKKVLSLLGLTRKGHREEEH